MEKFILGLFTEHLSKIIVGFRKEQVNASLLTGKGEISDVQINVKPLNDFIATFVQYVELSSVFVSKLSFNVSSFTKLKKAPIEITIDEIHIIAVEPLNYVPFDESSWRGWAKERIEKALRRRSYGLLDRIGDNVTIDINRIYITFQSMGKFKTKRVGPWTPPALSMVLNNLRFVSVDEYGMEGSPEAVWRHNSRRWRAEQSLKETRSDRALRPKTIFIYKKLTMDISVAVGLRTEGMTAKETFFNSRQLVSNVPIQVQFALHKRLKDAAILAVQIDASMYNVETEIDADTLLLLVHAAAGMQFCVVKDKSFCDPFDNANIHSDSSVQDDTPISHVENVHVEYEGTNDESSLENDSQVRDDNSMLGDESEEGSSSDEDLLPSNLNNDKGELPWPALILPSGIIIVEQLCITVSIHNAAIRTKYKTDEHYLQLNAKGIAADIIWSSQAIEQVRKGVLQFSISYVSLQEYSKTFVKEMFAGGKHNDQTKEIRLETSEADDESFPKFETKSIRNDPINLRNTYPVQAFGLKTTLEIQDEQSASKDQENYHAVSCEVGMDGIVVTFHYEACERALTFFSYSSNSLFDPRWLSGDWSDVQLLPLHIDFPSHIQNLPGEIETERLPLTGLFNLSAKVSSVKLRIPAPIEDVLQSSEIMITLDQGTIFISSTFPSHETGAIECKNEDACNESTTTKEEVKSGQKEGKIGNQYRLQVSLNVFSISATPYVQLLSTKEQKNIVTLTKVTTLCNYQPGGSEGNDNNCINARWQDKLFLSIVTNGVKVNIDADVITSSLSTLSHNGLSVNSERTIVQREGIKLANNISFNATINVESLEVDVWVQRIPEQMDSESLSDILLLMSFKLKYLELRFGSVIVDRKIAWDQPGERTMIELMLGYLCFSVCDEISSGTKTRVVEFPENVSISTFPICSLGTDNLLNELVPPDNDEKALMIKLEIHWDEGLQFNTSMNILSGTLTLALKEMEDILTLSLSGLFPNTKSIVNSFRNKSNRLLTKVRTKPEIEGQKELLSSLFCTEIEDIQVALAFIHVESFNIVIPCYEESSDAFSFHWEEVDINSTFFHNVEKLNSYSSKVGSSFFIRERAPGFHHSVSFHQKLLYLGTSNMIERNQTVINSFSVKYCFNASQWSCNIEDCSMSIMEMEVWKQLCECLASCRTFFVRLVTSILDALANSEIEPIAQLDLNTPVGEANLLVSESLRSQRGLLERIKNEMSLYEQKLKDNFDTKEFELGKARSQLFEKEVALAHAHSFIANQACGFVYVAGVGNEQRSSLTTNFLRYWARLDETHIILSRHPSEVTPVDFIPLSGASLKALEGSAQKRDLNRGFALIDSNERCRYFLAEDSVEYEMWLRSISDAIDSCESLDRNPEIDKESKRIDSSNELFKSGRDGYLEEDKGLFSNELEIPIIEDVPDLEGMIESIEMKDSSASQEDLSVSTPSRKAKIRERMSRTTSKMKSAVKGAKSDRRTFRQLNNDIFRESKKTDSNNEHNSGRDVNLEDDEFLVEDEGLFSNELEIPIIEDIPDLEGMIESNEMKTSSASQEDLSESAPSRKAKIRERMSRTTSKMKSAVKGVKIDTSTFRQLNNDMFQKASRLRSGEERPSVKGNNSRMTRVRSLKCNDEEPQRKEEITNKDILLRTMKGSWNIQVESKYIPVEKVIGTESGQDDALVASNALLFEINLNHTSWQNGEETPTDNRVQKDLFQILEFHSHISESIVIAKAVLKAKDKFKQILTSGRVLREILVHLDGGGGGEFNIHFLEYTNKAIRSFFESLFAGPLPDVTYNTLKSFFMIKDTEEHGKVSPNIPSQEIPFVNGGSLIFAPNTVSLIRSLESCLTRTEVNVRNVERLLSESRKPSKKELPYKGNELSSNTYLRAMQSALTCAMTERDEVHAQLVASRVLHMHEMEQLKRKHENLKEKLFLIEKMENRESAAAAAFFLGQESIPDIHTLKQKSRDKMTQDSDEELLALCKQLSYEISCRVSSELESIRLKESRKLERDIELSQREDLQQQLKSSNLRMDQERQLRLETEEERNRWRLSYLQLLNADPHGKTM